MTAQERRLASLTFLGILFTEATPEEADRKAREWVEKDTKERADNDPPR